MFRPVAATFLARDDADAIRLANGSQYGLGLSVWLPSARIRVARQITSGAAFINAIVASDPCVPFGGTKRSGCVA